MISKKIFIEQLKTALLEGFDYVAQDEDEVWYAFHGKPIYLNGIWRAYPFKNEAGRVKHLFTDRRIAPPESTLTTITDKIKEYEQQL